MSKFEELLNNIAIVIIAMIVAVFTCFIPILSFFTTILALFIVIKSTATKKYVKTILIIVVGLLTIVAVVDSVKYVSNPKKYNDEKLADEIKRKFEKDSSDKANKIINDSLDKLDKANSLVKDNTKKLQDSLESVRRSYGDEYSAIATSEVFAKRLLTVPNSAKFSEQKAIFSESMDVSTTSKKDIRENIWYVTGAVGYKNNFNVDMKSRYICILYSTDGGKIYNKINCVFGRYE